MLNAYRGNSNHLASSEVSQILQKLGYKWSNESQCWYSTDFKMPLLNDDAGYNLADRINECFHVLYEEVN